MTFRVTCKGLSQHRVTFLSRVCIWLQLSCPKIQVIFYISVGNMCIGALEKVPGVALKQSGEDRSEAVEALQVLLCHFGSPIPA